MVDSNESVRLYSYTHFSSGVISSSPPPAELLLSAQPSKLPLILSTSDLSSGRWIRCDGNQPDTGVELKQPDGGEDKDCGNDDGNFDPGAGQQ